MERSMSVDLTAKQAKALKLGAKVEFTVKGKITELTAAHAYPSVAADGEDGTEKFPPSARIEVSSVKFNSNNDFANLADEEEKEVY